MARGKQVKRWLLHIFAAGSLLLFVLVCVYWVRGQSGVDSLEWRYDRWLADKSASADRIELTSHRQRLWIEVSHGWVGPYNGNLVYGYHINADQSGGRPKLSYSRLPYEPKPMGVFGPIEVGDEGQSSGIGPLRWQFFDRLNPPPGERIRMVRLGIPYWLAAWILILLPVYCVHRHLRIRRDQRRGKCINCGYDLRASPDRCPECGTPVAA